MNHLMEINRKLINVDVTEQGYFNVYVDIINSIYHFKLTSVQKSILSELYLQCFKYRNLSVEDKSNLIFSTNNRRDIVNKLDLNLGTFNNTISLLRGKKSIYGVILNDTIVNEDYIHYPTEDNLIAVRLKLKVNED